MTSISDIQSNTNQVYFQNSQKNLGSSKLDREGFMRLMLAQLQYQDPTEPQDNSQMMSQQLQLEQADQMKSMVDATKFSQASTMIGKVATLVDAPWDFDAGATGQAEWDATTNGPKVISGVIDSVQFDSSHGTALALINGQYYDISNIQNLYDAPQLPGVGDVASASNLIGKTVKLPDIRWNDTKKSFDAAQKDSSGNTAMITGTVQDVKFDPATRNTLIKVNGNYYAVESIQQALGASSTGS